MACIRFLLGDQLSLEISSLNGVDKKNDIIVMAEVYEESEYVPHHQKKIAFLFSAMRHFAESLKKEGFQVIYFKLGQQPDLKSLTDVAQYVLNKNAVDKIVVTAPGEYRVLKDIEAWASFCQCEIRDDDRFLTSIDDFNSWAADKKQLKMEFFYRTMRQKYQILMEGGQPCGGQWNYDLDNRKKPPKDLEIPKPMTFMPDAITADVISLVKAKFGKHFGELEPFSFAVTREDALKVLDVFITERLPNFGQYQDAMIEGEPWMFHSLISFYLNCGLLNPMECIELAESSYHDGSAPINAVEGFIRQILGWREYIRGVYWLKMPDYKNENFFAAKRALPDFYWTGDTQLNCIKQCVSETSRHAYAHHIQRLMVLGNFLLLTGVNPDEVNEWYLCVYADAYEWVELPNVTGMTLFADGGFLASKPYASGGAYINKMSNYCQNCVYSIKEKTGEKACPFNYLYWHFLIRNEDKLRSQHRLAMMYRQIDKMPSEKIEAIKLSSEQFLSSL